MRYRAAIGLFFQSIFLFLCLFLLLNQPLISYALQQGRGQLTIVWNAKESDKVLESAEYPDSVKAKLRLVGDIKQFAFDSLGIHYSKNYSTVYNQNKKAIMFVVTACLPYSFDAYEWSFPILGNVPYKGFFKKSNALVEYYKMKEKGYDTHLGTVSGWSTLGWFTDPVLSNMLYYSDGDLAELIIHELTHGTLYVKNDATFNENLASFIGYKGAIQFLNSKYGNNSPQLQEYLQDKADEKKTSAFMLGAARLLDSLYKSFPPQMHDSIKEKNKLAQLQKILASSDTLKIHNLKRFKNYLQKSKYSKNAFFMQYVRYESRLFEFEKEFGLFHTNLAEYLAYLKQKYPSL